MQKCVFVLCPPYSGSTALWRLLHLLEFFKYDLLHPSKLHNFHYYNGVAKKMTGRVKRFVGEWARFGQ